MRCAARRGFGYREKPPELYPCVGFIESYTAKIARVATRPLKSYNRLVIKKSISGCVPEACDRLLQVVNRLVAS